jgi:hypothetical protein
MFDLILGKQTAVGRFSRAFYRGFRSLRTKPFSFY